MVCTAQKDLEKTGMEKGTEKHWTAKGKRCEMQAVNGKECQWKGKIIPEGKLVHN